MQGSISVQTIRSYLGLASTRGLDVGATVEAAGAEKALEDIDARLPWALCERIAFEIVRRIRVAGAIEAMASLGEGGGGLLHYVARHSATVGLGLRRVVQYYVLTSSVADCELLDQASPARLELRQRPYVTAPVRDLISGLWCVSNVTMLRQMLGRDFQPLAVELEMPRPEPVDLRAYEVALRCPMRFDAQRSTVAIDPAVLGERVRGADPVLEAAVMKYAAELLDRPDPDGVDAIRSRLRRHLVGNMRSGHVALEAAARELGMTTRTLQRRLRDEGTSFHAVLDDVRRDVALTQMRARRQSIDELAFVLGFEKSSSFHRAFKRWTGVTPGEFRKHG
jgi:AraC-like DNA-binding protein